MPCRMGFFYGFIKNVFTGMKGKFIALITSILLSTAVYAQHLVKGKIIDASSRQPVENAHIVLNNGTDGVVTDAQGNFRFYYPKISGAFSIERVGYQTEKISFKTKKQGVTSLPPVLLTPKSYSLNEINITAGLVTNAKAPVSVSTISARTIKSRLGDRPLPLVMNSVPGVFSVRNGGGSGDASLTIRGFQQDNVALLLNGIPINGVENGLVYWSNWLGLSDAATSIQIQKGPGFSNLASNAVGGSINIITRANNKPRGGSVNFQITDYGNQKTTLAWNSGKMKNGWKISLLAAYYSGKGYVDATYVKGFSYFFSANKQLNKKNHLNITLLGSPQHHGQRTQLLSASEEKIHGNKYNKDWGGLDGKMLNASENFYHKPFLTINHDWQINEKSRLSNTVFVSYGYGGGKWSDSFHYAPSIFSYRTASGQIDWPKIYQLNAGNTQPYVLANGDTVSGYSTHVLTGFLASHIQTGFMSTFEEQFGSQLKLTAGVYYNYLNSFLREKITDLLGGKFYIEDYAWSLSGVAGRNQIKTVGDIIKVNNNSIIHHMAAYTRLTYTGKYWQAYLSVNGNDHRYRRIDRFNYITQTHSPVINRLGYDFRGGISYMPVARHHFYLNGAFISRAPYFKYVFGNFNNTPVQGLENERIQTLEAGYRFSRPGLKAVVNAYYTLWQNVSLLSNEYVQLSDNRQSRAMVHGLNSVHKGIEAQIEYRLNNLITVGARASLGDFRWQNDVSATLINDNNVVTDTVNVYARNLHVGGTAQQQIGAYTEFRLFRLLQFHVDWTHYNQLYADFDPVNRNRPDDRKQPYAFPAYDVVNASVSLPFHLAKRPSLLQINGYNLLNKNYIVRGQDGLHHNLQDFRGFWSFGINFNLTWKVYL
jgi:iron complex outermembrane receptor protein